MGATASVLVDKRANEVSTFQKLFNKTGLYTDDQFLSELNCQHLLSKIKTKQAQQPLPVIKRMMPGRSLNYQVMDGHYIQQHLPEVYDLAPRVLQRAQSLCRESIKSLINPTAAVNVNITNKGGEYRWHYDRNAITAIVYLNEVEGGDTELLPNSRKYLGPLKSSFLQRWVDQRLIDKLVNEEQSTVIKITPKPGRLIIMKGDRCLHSVNPVTSDTARYNLIFSFDNKNRSSQVEKNLDPYLYSVEKSPDFDPNYKE